MPQSTQPGSRQWTLWAGLAAAALLALVTAWTAALARVPQQRAAVERLLRAQTGLDVSYARLVVRLGFYGPEAEFSDIEMRQPGAAAPLLRAPRMVARFESWRLLRGGQLRPGRVLVSGAELDLRQLATLRRDPTAVAASPAPAPATAAGAPRDTLLEDLEARLPALLAGIPEGSLDFEALTLVWTNPARPSEPLQLRAPRLYASRRIDGAQLSGTVLLPTRLGRTLFVAAQVRDDGRAAADGLHGRLRASGRGLVLSSWREFGLLPRTVTGGTGDITLSVQLRAGRVQQAEGSARLAGFGLAVPKPVVARRFSLASGQFTFARTPTALRYRLEQVEMVPAGADARAFGERGSLQFARDPRDGSSSLRVERLPVELAALLVGAGGDGVAAAALPLRVGGGEVLRLEAGWGAAGTADSLTMRGRFAALELASTDGAWRIEGVGATLEASGPRLSLALEGRDLPLQGPWFEAVAAPVRIGLDGRVEVAVATGGWSLAIDGLALDLVDGPALRLQGSAGAVRDGASASDLRLSLATPLERSDMTLLQATLGRVAPEPFWQAFTAGRLEAAEVALAGGEARTARLQLRGVTLAAAPDRPGTTALDADLDWDGRRLDGRVLGGQVGALSLASGRFSMPLTARGAGAAGLTVEAQLAGPLEDALRLAAAGEWPGQFASELAGAARLEARLRIPTTPRGARGLDLAIDVEAARWRPVAGAAPLTDLRGRLSADQRGLRGGQLEGRWLGGPVQLRLDGDTPDDLRLAASGRLPAAALEREWAWIDLVDRARDGELAWSAELRRDADGLAPGRVTRDGRARGDAGARRNGAASAATDPDELAWRMRVALPGSARADLRWMPGVSAEAPWRIDRGTVVLGDGAAITGIPGALVVGGRLERLELSGLAGVIASFGASDGWQRPLVGEVQVADLQLGDSGLGSVRLRLAGSRESTAVDLLGESIAGELRQVHAEPARLRGSFARLRLPARAQFAALAGALLPLRTALVLQVAELQRGDRALGALDATFESDGESVATRDLELRRGARRAAASGRCERATLGCSAELRIAEADVGGLLQDLGYAPALRGRDLALIAKLDWSMQPGASFAGSLQGGIELTATLEGAPADPAGESAAGEVATAAADSGDADAAGGLPDRATEPTWALLAPLLAVTTRQSAELQASLLPAVPPAPRDPGATPAPVAVAASAALPEVGFERLELRLSLRDGVAEIERYEAIGRDARLSVAGRFDFARGTLEQQAQWFWIAPGVAGAVERLDPRSPLAATLRTLRDLFPARGPPTAAVTRGLPGPGAAERFELTGPASMPRVERLPLTDSPR